jgi:hypothetical protein
MFTLKAFAPRPRWTYIVRALAALAIVVIVRHLAAAHSAVAHAENLFLTTDWLVMKCLDILLNKLAITSYFNTDVQKEFEQDFPVGDSVRVKFPQKYLIRDGWEYQGQGINRQYTVVPVDQPFGIDFEWDTYERAVKMERSEEALEREYLEPAMAQMFQEFESRASLFAYQNANNIVGQLGTDPIDFDTSSAAARVIMSNLACPTGKDRGCILPPAVMGAQKERDRVLQSRQRHQKLYREGIVGKADGFDFYESVSLYSHTAGTWAGAVTVNGAGQSGSTLTITATAGDTFNKGDVFSMANVNSVNPMTRRKVGSSAKHVHHPAGADRGGRRRRCAPDLAGNLRTGLASTRTSTRCRPTAPRSRCSPARRRRTARAGTQGLAIHPNAFAMVGLPLENPKKEEQQSKHKDPDSGLELAFIRSFDAKSRKWINRFDTFVGYGRLYSDSCAVRILCA